MPGQPRSRVGVGLICQRSDGRILLGFRHKEGERPSWCLPGGHLEPGETFERAAVRELAEEAGIEEVTAPAMFAVVLGSDPTEVMVTAGVHARVDGATRPQVLEPDVFAEWIWADPEELPAPLFGMTARLMDAWRAGHAARPGTYLVATG